ncbi:MAG: hypothetical protein HY983_04055 [Candidatus Magasanikbacteria bacterium]|nr:hypothetical protein [Candidatus Magasanikbacteria bacterium]
MKSRTFLLGISLVGAGALFIYFGLHHIFILPQPAPATSATVAAPRSRTFASRSDEQGEVSVEVQPIKIETSGQAQFTVTLNTHSVELNDDLTKQTALYDDQSHFYKPISWTGAEPGGHHRSGTLTFGPLNSQPQYVELKIKDVGGIPLRTFRWDLK